MANKKRLIDANALECALKDTHIGLAIDKGKMFRLIENAPTVDAVEVVRCKDCRHYVLHALACRNEHMNGVIAMDGFCSYGERKDNG